MLNYGDFHRLRTRRLVPPLPLRPVSTMEGRACESGRATIKPLEVLLDEFVLQDTRFSCWNLGNKLTFLMKPGVLENWNDGMDSPNG